MNNDFWQAFLVNLVNVLLPVIVTSLPVIATALTALLVQYIRLVQAKISKEYPSQYEVLESICKNAILIAEQMKIGGLIEDKKKFAVDYVQKELESKGIVIDMEKIEQDIKITSHVIKLKFGNTDEQEQDGAETTER